MTGRGAVGHAGDVDDDSMRSHFWWRPGWAPGRAYLTWHVLPDPGVVEHVGVLQERIADVGNLALVPAARLHITGPGVGFVDAVPADRAAAMVEAARAAATRTQPFTARVHDPYFGSEGVYLPIDAPQLSELRDLLRAAMRTAGIDPPGSDDEPYFPHVSIAYATGSGSRGAVAERIGTPPEPPELVVTAAHLLALRMEPAGYDWEVLATAPLGPTGPPD